MFGLCWHKYTKWSKPIETKRFDRTDAKIMNTIGRKPSYYYIHIQTRNCQKCGKIEQRDI